jgi:prepilin-type N-terminal cleavage/methylation domain-containing protein
MRGVIVRRNAFTLLELLVVIVIITVLAGLITSAAYYALSRGREIGCQNNIRQLALAIQRYTTQNNRPLPPPCNENDSGYDRGWLYGSDGGVDEGLLVRQELVGSPEVFLCPTHMDDWELYRPAEDEVYWEPASQEVDGETHRLVGGRVYSSYSMNALTYHSEGNMPRRWEEFNPLHFLLVEESVVDSRYDDGAIEPNPNDEITTRHHGGGYVACFGGHVIFVPRESDQDDDVMDFDESMDDDHSVWEEARNRRWLPVTEWDF